MAKQRIVKTVFWNKGYIRSLEPNGKLLYLYLMTGELATLSGAYVITTDRMAWDTGLTEIEVRAWLEKFEADNKVLYRGDWICVLNTIEHQTTTNPKIRAGVVAEVKCCPDWIKDRLSIRYDWLSHLNLNLNSNFNFKTHIGAASDSGFPMQPLFDAFPDYLPDRITPAQVGFIEAQVKPGDEIPWSMTIRDYQQNFNPTLGRYLPDKVANLLSVFRRHKEQVEKQKNGSNQTNFGRKGNAAILDESAEYFRQRFAEEAERERGVGNIQPD